MKNIVGTVLLFAITFYSTAQKPIDTSSKKSPTQKLDEFLISLSNAHKFNGTALIAQKGKILLHKGYGWKNAAANTFNDTNSIYQIGSLTKPFTAQIILKLQELGKLSITDKLNKYLLDYPNGEKITIENLLTHTSGIASYDAEEKDTITWSPVEKADVLSVFKNKPLEFEPGSIFRYSNSGYFLLGMIAEKAGGKPYEQIVRELIFVPLQMTHSGFDFIHLQDTLKATGYKTLNAERQITVHLIDSTVSYATGEMYSSTGDLYKWAKSLADKQILSPGSWKKALTAFHSNYGYGFFIDSMNGKKYVGHSGGITGFTSNFVYFPDEDVTIILVNNFLYEGDERDNQPVLPVQELSAIIFDKPYTPYREKKEIKVNDTSLNKYIGTYALSTTPKRTIIVTKQDGSLMATIPGVTTMQFVFNTDTQFQFKNLLNAEGEFITTNGKVIKMVISQNGLFEWIKIK
jgi:CubicO group peptidase (beta-lactamase class C family)